MSDHPGKPARGLLRVLGVMFGVAIVVGNSVGMGILRTPGEVAARVPSASLFLAVWVVGGLYALMSAMCMAELAAMHPRSGGGYPLVHRALGPYAGFVVGWTDWIATCGTMAAVAIVLGEYSGPLIPLLRDRVGLTAGTVIILFMLLQWSGVRMGDAAQRWMSLLKALALVGLALVAIALGPRTPGTVGVTATALPTGTVMAAGIVIALQSAIFTFTGWAGPTYFGDEVQDPGRALPRSMIGGVLLVLVIYLTLNVAFLRVVPIGEMAGDPFVVATVATRVFGPAGDTVLRILMMLSLLTSVNGIQMVTSRIPFAMSQDGLLPSRFSEVNEGGTPTLALLAGTVVAIGFIATNTFDTVLALLAFFFVANFLLIFISLFVMRAREPDAPRPFRVPGYPWVPGIALAGSIAFLIGAVAGDWDNSVRAILLLALGTPVYLLIRRRSA
jgi:basic amino acid/polyamine antiporter, APA family